MKISPHRIRASAVLSTAAFLAALLAPVPPARSAPPAETSSFTSFAYLAPDTLVAAGSQVEDAVGAWDRYAGLGHEFLDEDERKQMDREMARMHEELGFDPRGELFPLLRGELALGISLDSIDALFGLGVNPNPAGAEMVLEGILLTVGLSDAEAFDALVRRVLAHHGWTRHQVGTLAENPLWKIPLGSEGKTLAHLYMGRHGDRVLLGFSPGALSGAVARFASGPSLGGSRDFLRVRAHLPRQVTSLGYLNLPALAEKVRQAGMVRMAASASPQGMKALEKFLSPEMVPFGMGWATSRNDGGVTRTSWGPDTLLGQLPLGNGIAMPMAAAVAVPNLLNAMERGRAKRTAADLRDLGEALAAHKESVGAYPRQPTLAPADQLESQLDLVSGEELPREDGWGHPLLYWSDGESYILLAPAKRGDLQPDLKRLKPLRGTGSSSPTEGQKEGQVPMVYSDGGFLDYPG